MELVKIAALILMQIKLKNYFVCQYLPFPALSFPMLPPYALVA